MNNAGFPRAKQKPIIVKFSKYRTRVIKQVVLPEIEFERPRVQMTVDQRNVCAVFAKHTVHTRTQPIQHSLLQSVRRRARVKQLDARDRHKYVHGTLCHFNP